MKRFIKIFIIVLSAVVLASCAKEKYGTTPGTETTASVRVYVSGAELPYDSDCDALLRLAANKAAQDVYFLAEPTEDMKARDMTPEAYAKYIVKNGIKATTSTFAFDGTNSFETVLEGLVGSNTITAVAVDADGNRTWSSAEFYAVPWINLATGTYYFGTTNSIVKRNIPGSSVITTLQKRGDSDSVYRFKNLFGAGNHLEINTIGLWGEDEDGEEYQFVRVPAQATGLSDASYGAINVRDIGYWQSDDSYITEGGFESLLYDDCTMYIMMQWYVTAGSCGYAWYDSFIPNVD